MTAAAVLALVPLFFPAPPQKQPPAARTATKVARPMSSSASKRAQPQRKSRSKRGKR